MTLPQKTYFIYLAIINVILFVLMGYDKARAQRDEWRVPEATLFILGLLGGAPLGLVAMKAFRHKTRKPLFYIIFVLGLVGIVAMLYLIGAEDVLA